MQASISLICVDKKKKVKERQSADDKILKETEGNYFKVSDTALMLNQMSFKLFLICTHNIFLTTEIAVKQHFNNLTDVNNLLFTLLTEGNIRSYLIVLQNGTVCLENI